MQRNHTIRLPGLMLTLLLALAPFGLGGCDQNDGPLEEMGESIDDAADDAEDALD